MSNTNINDGLKPLTVGVIGGGTMGSGIAQIAATSGCRTLVFDSSPEALKNSAHTLEKVLARLVEKEKITEEKKHSVINNIQYINELNHFTSSNLIIEAIIEDANIKKGVFSELEQYVSDDCILASNTSSLSVTSLAAALKKPERFIGIHFFNPAPLMKLVEIVPAIQTSNKIAEKTRNLINSWGKLTVMAKDTPGFIVNKVARPFYSEALRIYEEGIADFATIDWSMKELGGFRMGPFELMDFIGNDVNYTVTETVFNAFYYDPRYKPSFTQKRLTEAGYLGRKSGRGYYEYAEGKTSPGPDQDHALGELILQRILAMLINEAADTVHMGIASKEDIDIAMTTGVNYPKGLLHWADEIGILTCVNRMDELYELYHEDRYRCSGLLRQMAREEKLFFENSTVIND
ncbi:3-hydroxybutyryl-CoA dehydrogenase [Fulvivirga sp. M361]|uniref:3-hydroxyacyl-CoA dehydrogenase NAD-binding domain-containing protein n=1 Tax=Fulvivirga sp. M361 TaxID=2594266 RepID=UPI00117A17AE|nr:3-hydroxyacyl-CoA dehydrogenase NAD-binding domain-containing protein [Fulvivirga sp. M361]TRX48482.1 3-hydroxybutyryl-CoA dehydrogenase [Fulvivirga sp. M361]